MNECVDQRTIGYSADEISCEGFLLPKVQPGWDLWGIGIVGPGRSPWIGHDFGVCDSGCSAEGWVSCSWEAGQTKRKKVKGVNRL